MQVDPLPALVRQRYADLDAEPSGATWSQRRARSRAANEPAEFDGDRVVEPCTVRDGRPQ